MISSPDSIPNTIARSLGYDSIREMLISEYLTPPDATMNQLGKEWGVNPMTISYWMKKHQLKGKPRGHRNTTVEKILASRRKLAGMTAEEIGERFGCSRVWAQRVCKEHGIKYLKLKRRGEQ